ncbi:hypothetical protein [Rhizobium binae]|nr:hypothetical protein [Rhizobium binae]MBX4929561.1 hypothetical protein [Rhizobium binae]
MAPALSLISRQDAGEYPLRAKLQLSLQELATYLRNGGTAKGCAGDTA